MDKNIPVGIVDIAAADVADDTGRGNVPRIVAVAVVQYMSGDLNHHFYRILE